MGWGWGQRGRAMARDPAADVAPRRRLSAAALVQERWVGETISRLNCSSSLLQQRLQACSCLRQLGALAVVQASQASQGVGPEGGEACGVGGQPRQSREISAGHTQLQHPTAAGGERQAHACIPIHAGRATPRASTVHRAAASCRAPTPAAAAALLTRRAAARQQRGGGQGGGAHLAQLGVAGGIAHLAGRAGRRHREWAK